VNSQGMCLAIPGKVLEIDGRTARVDFGYGATREVVDEEDALETLRLWREMLGYIEPA